MTDKMMTSELNHAEKIAHMEMNLAQARYFHARESLPEAKEYEEAQAIVASLRDNDHYISQYDCWKRKFLQLKHSLPEYERADKYDWDEESTEILHRAMSGHPGIVRAYKLMNFHIHQALKHPSQNPDEYGRRDRAWEAWNEASSKLTENATHSEAFQSGTKLERYGRLRVKQTRTLDLVKW